jgi:hypothetical protein
MAKIRINPSGHKFLVRCKEALDTDELETIADVLEAYQAKDPRVIDSLTIVDVLTHEHRNLLDKVFAWQQVKRTLPKKPKK